jgi:hypothetical protein
MPANKDFKRLVRGRMQKTGESYTAARAQLLHRNPATKPNLVSADAPAAVALPTRAPAPADYARLAGMSDAKLKASTGCTWERWVKALDRVEAHAWAHRKIAQYVREKYHVGDWWTQTVTVGYERIKGLRAKGQRRDGSFEASKSRTFPAPLGRLYRAFRDAPTRARWLPGIGLTIRTATREKSMRISWPDGTSLDVGFARRGPGRSQVALQHAKLPDRETALRMKQFWAERLGALGDLLAAE